MYRDAGLRPANRRTSGAHTRAPCGGHRPRLSRAAFERGRVLAAGDIFQVVRGDKVTSRLLFRFKDGSVDDETAVFSQRGNFQLITDHHVQKGPSFPQPMDMSIDVHSGQVAVRSKGKDGKEEVKSEHLDLPPDLINGLILSIAKNIRPETPETKVSMVVATPKPRLVKVAISPHGEEPFSLVGSHRKAMRFVLKIEHGGVAGVVAPLIGKAPPESQIWIIGGLAPAFVKEEGPLYQGGPVWTIQLTSPFGRIYPVPAFRIARVCSLVGG